VKTSQLPTFSKEQSQIRILTSVNTETTKALRQGTGGGNHLKQENRREKPAEGVRLGRKGKSGLTILKVSILSPTVAGRGNSKRDREGAEKELATKKKSRHLTQRELRIDRAGRRCNTTWRNERDGRSRTGGKGRKRNKLLRNADGQDSRNQDSCHGKKKKRGIIVLLPRYLPLQGKPEESRQLSG